MSRSKVLFTSGDSKSYVHFVVNKEVSRSLFCHVNGNKICIQYISIVRRRKQSTVESPTQRVQGFLNVGSRLQNIILGMVQDAKRKSWQYF